MSKLFNAPSKANDIIEANLFAIETKCKASVDVNLFNLPLPPKSVTAKRTFHHRCRPAKKPRFLLNDCTSCAEHSRYIMLLANVCFPKPANYFPAPAKTSSSCTFLFSFPIAQSGSRRGEMFQFFFDIRQKIATRINCSRAYPSQKRSSINKLRQSTQKIKKQFCARNLCWTLRLFIASAMGRARDIRRRWWEVFAPSPTSVHVNNMWTVTWGQSNGNEAGEGDSFRIYFRRNAKAQIKKLDKSRLRHDMALFLAARILFLVGLQRSTA